MAHILNSSKYGEGHKVVLKPKVSNKLAVEFRKNGYKLGSSIFTITNTYKVWILFFKDFA